MSLRTVVIAIAALVLLCVGHVSGQVIVPSAAPAGLVAAYAMSNTIDASGNGHAATFLNTSTVPGKYNQGQLFAGGDGTSRMTAPNITLTSAFTLEAWVKFTALTRMVVGTRSPRDAPSGWQAIIYKSHDIVWLAETGGVVMGGFTPQGVTESVGLLAPTPVTLNVFHHVALTYDGANLALVVDGLQVANRPATGMVQSTTSPLEVGGSGVDGGGLQGVVDDVRIYSRGLTLADIAKDLATPVDASHEDVVSWDIDVFTRDAPANTGGSPIATGNFLKSNALCNLAPLPRPVVTVENPSKARVSDPVNAGNECELVSETFMHSLPVGVGYTSTARARGATTVSERSPASNPFDIVAVVTPPPPSGPPVVR